MATVTKSSQIITNGGAKVTNNDHSTFLVVAANTYAILSVVYLGSASGGINNASLGQSFLPANGANVYLAPGTYQDYMVSGYISWVVFGNS